MIQDYEPTLLRQTRLNNDDAALAKRIMGQACRSRARANSINFNGAVEYLPITDEPLFASTDNTPDWKSIMIYASGVGGKVTGDVVNGDNRAPVLLQPNGQRIPINLVPSPRDIHALRALYGGTLGAPQANLLGDLSSPAKGRFDSIRRKDRSSGCLPQ